MGVTAGVISCFLLAWDDIVCAGVLKYAGRAICFRKKPAMIFESLQVVRQQQLFLVN
jgi:hypothetical protein